MSRERKLGIAATIVGLVVGVIAVTASAKGSLDGRYETRSSHQQDMLRVEGKIDRVLDVVCEGRDKTRACQ